MTTQTQLVPGQPKQSQRGMSGKEFADEMMYRLFAPIIIYPGGWEETITEDMKFKAKMHRLHKPFGEELATDYEACLYIMTATLCFPLDEEWYRIYMHLFAKCFPDKAKDVLGDDRAELEPYQESKLRELKSRIYKSQVKAVRERAKEEEEAGELRIAETQTTLFWWNLTNLPHRNINTLPLFF